MTKSKRKKLIRLIEQWTRAEIISRFGKFNNLEFVSYVIIKIEIENKIRKLLYKTDSLYDLGIKWGLLKAKPEKKGK